MVRELLPLMMTIELYLPWISTSNAMRKIFVRQWRPIDLYKSQIFIPNDVLIALSLVRSDTIT